MAENNEDVTCGAGATAVARSAKHGQQKSCEVCIVAIEVVEEVKSPAE